MFELVISNVNTGRVLRSFFETRAQAEAHFDGFLDYFGHRPENRRPRNRRDYRVEVYHRPLPEVRKLKRRVELEPAA
jgi:hypothetical protein